MSADRESSTERLARHEAVDELRKVARNWGLRRWQIEGVETQLRAIVGVYRERTNQLPSSKENHRD